MLLYRVSQKKRIRTYVLISHNILDVQSYNMEYSHILYKEVAPNFSSIGYLIEDIGLIQNVTLLQPAFGTVWSESVLPLVITRVLSA